MKISKKHIICLVLLGLLLLPANASSLSTIINSTQDIGVINPEEDSIYYFINENNEIIKTVTDLPPLDDNIDYKIIFTIKEIRAFDIIDIISDPDFYVKLYVNDEQFLSKTWFNQKYVNETWSITVDVPDDKENVTIKIQLWDQNPGKDRLCDIGNLYDQSLIDKRDIDIIYNLKTGHWIGDDFLSPNSGWGSDFSGYGRVNGCDDGTYYQNDRDCELIFDITQNDEDGDGIPTWTEKYIYHSDPNINNTGWDNDSDGVPIEWEWKWGNTFYYNYWNHRWEYYWFYNPNNWEDQATLDPDEDGLQNIEEYYTSQWGSNPFLQDVFLELDQMELGPEGQGGFVPDLANDLLRDAFGKRNIFIHIDDGCMGGGEKTIPFDIVTTHYELLQIYWDFFLHNDPNNWRRGVFHYAIIDYNAPKSGYAFSTRVNDKVFLDCFQLSTDIMEDPVIDNIFYNIIRRKTLNKEMHRAIRYAGTMMHELGHTFGISGPGHASGNHFKYRNYKSCMNYDNVYWLVDYSDGTHGKYDFDDWDAIDLTYFQK